MLSHFLLIPWVILLLFGGLIPARAAVEPNWPVLEYENVVADMEQIVDIQNARDGSRRSS